MSIERVEQANAGSLSDVGLLVLLTALGANTLIVELVIPRMIAPVFGNTLFSWTAIIAVVLVALTLGYRIGGLLAARVSLRRFIATFSVAAALWVLLLSLIGDAVVQHMRPLNMMFGPLVAAALLAAVPAFLDAAVVPMAIQAIPGNPGDVSGRCFAWSTVGSILGVLFTGYVLLPQLGINGALITGALLISLSLVPLRWFVPSAMLGASCLAVLAVGAPLDQQFLVDMSNGYHRIRVIETGPLRTLYLDNTLEGSVRLDDDKPALPHVSRLIDIVQEIATQRANGIGSAFMLGGGSFSIPRFLKLSQPDMQVRVAELDPDVIRVARQYFDLTDQVDVVTGDGRRVLAEDRARYDLIVNDAFHGVRNIPFHLTTREFNRLVHDHLSENGIYAVNVRGLPSESFLASSFVRTLAADFPHLYVETVSKSNSWLIAAKRPLAGANSVADVGREARLLTDNHAPIEYLVVRDLVDERLRRNAEPR